MFLRLARSQVRFTTRLNRVTQFPKLNESAAATSLPHTSMFRASFADWIPPPSTDDRAQSSERRPAGGGAHFPGSPPSAPLVHDHPHKSVVKIGDNEWQASVLIDGEFYELGVFPTKSEAADEVRQWNEVVNDDLLPDVLPSWLGGSRDDSNDPGAWIRPETTVGFDNPILNGEGKELIEDPVTVLEAIECLQHENGEEISLLDISTHRGGGNHIGDYLVFATGKSQAHLRKMGDVLVKALQQRGQWDLQPLVEGRDDDDGWMIVDCGDFIVHLFEADAREYFAVEELWMKNGCERVENVDEHVEQGVIADRPF